jgi:hypothetical protein
MGLIDRKDLFSRKGAKGAKFEKEERIFFAFFASLRFAQDMLGAMRFFCDQGRQHKM